ncbi:CPBP family intramembrane metalloprotease [bacterium]|nr:CPBP family intramembrane metalloprotease [bacterium]
MTRKPLFWVVFGLFAVLCLVFSLHYFKEAFSILNLEIELDRETALLKASTLMDRYGFGPSDYTQAVVFGDDSEFQCYVELEAGGKEAYQKIIDARIFRPFTWVVRHFREGQTNETSISFTPEGQVYEFVEKLPEDQAGAALDAEQARTIAERTAGEHWSVVLSDYIQVEASQKTQPSGRIDHTFEYERPDQKVGDAPYRLKLVVGGDRLIELDHYYRVPESFQRKYSEMRSANNTITLLASVALGILYILGGCLIGVFLLMKKRYILWKQPLFWGFLVSFVSVLGQINLLPLEWMQYDTALSAQTFLMRTLVQYLSVFIFDGLLLVISFMAAESLTRLAFPRHIQFWRAWSGEAAPSKAVLGRTVSAYLLIICFIAYEVALQFFGKAIPGWWSPASALTDPNILASYLPWFTPISISFHAGFWEECLFRAVPLAGAALIGQRLGQRRLFIILAMIVQALIFGGGHANYPAQPSFARVLELIIPSLTFGFLYLEFGLLPAIIMHYAFDVVMMSIPLMAANGLWFDKTMALIFVLVPLWVVLGRRLQSKSWHEVPRELYNESWAPGPVLEKSTRTVSISADVLPKKALVSIVLIGLCGFLLFLLCADFRKDFPTVQPDRRTAREQAIASMSARPDFKPADWQVLTRLDAFQESQHRFIWQEGGPELYQNLLGTYLEAPHWTVRFARFQGDVAERAEEYSVVFRNDGSIQGIRHILPQARAGADLSQETATELALTYIKRQYGLDRTQLEPISAVSTKQPARRDWTFTYAVPEALPRTEGQARIEIVLSGDTMTSFNEYVFVPEDWKRQERQQQQTHRLVQAPFQIAGLLGLVSLFVISLIQWSKKRYSRPTFLYFYSILITLTLLSFINRWPTNAAYFSTTEPLTHQIMARIASLLAPLIGFAFLAIIMGYVHRARRQQGLVSAGTTWLTAVAFAVLAAGFAALIDRSIPTLEAFWPAFEPANCYLSMLQPLFRQVQAMIIATAFFLALIVCVDQLSQGWTQRRPLVIIIFLCTGFILQTTQGIESLPAFCAGGLLYFILTLLAYLLVFRYHLAVLPLTVAVIFVLRTAAELRADAYPGAPIANALAIIALIILGQIWANWLNRPEPAHELNPGNISPS